MWDFQEAQDKVVQVARTAFSPGIERLVVSQAGGRVLAETVLSPVDMPAWDYSAMDGYAVHTREFEQGSSPELPVVGECQTGHPGVSVEPGTCVRIFTGAPIPPGANAVVMQENTTRTGDRVTFSQPPGPFENIRRAGEDLRAGDCVLTGGLRLSAYHLGLLASVERTEVLTARRPRALILCTGDELRPPGAAFERGSVAESNSVALAAMVGAVGGEATRGPLVKDTLPTMIETLRSGAERCDVLVTVGGVSVGDHDLVLPALTELGAEIYFHKVRIKPGKPVLFARLGRTLVLGLPGNPASAQVTFALFGVPLLRALQGDAEPVASLRTGRLAQPFRQKPGRRGFYRARLQGERVEIFSNQASGATTSMAWANGLAVIGEEESSLEAGAPVPFLAYNDL